MYIENPTRLSEITSCNALSGFQTGSIGYTYINRFCNYYIRITPITIENSYKYTVTGYLYFTNEQIFQYTLHLSEVQKFLDSLPSGFNFRRVIQWIYRE